MWVRFPPSPLIFGLLIMIQSNLFSSIEEHCQLHEEVEIIYVVDGYIVQLNYVNGDLPGPQVHRKTILEALNRLNAFLSKHTREAVKAMFVCKPADQLKLMEMWFDEKYGFKGLTLPSEMLIQLCKKLIDSPWCEYERS